jgi:hypothetical protein
MVKDHEEMLHAFEAEAVKAGDSKLKDLFQRFSPSWRTT